MAPVCNPSFYEPCNTLQYLAIPCNTLQYSALPCYTLLYPAIHCNTTQRAPPPFLLLFPWPFSNDYRGNFYHSYFSLPSASLPFIMFNNLPGSSDTFLERQFLFPLQRVSNDSRLVTTIQSLACLSFQSTDNGALSLFADIIISPTTVTE